MPVIAIECSPCRGRGLFKGTNETQNVAVVCRNCKGTGRLEFDYTPFTERQPAPEGTELVIKRNEGFVMDNNDAHVTLEEWQTNPEKLDQIGTEPRLKICPTLWYQMTNSSLKPQWPECPWGVPITTCPKWDEKAQCWEKWDQEFNRANQPEETTAN